MKKLKGVFLDMGSLDNGDLDLRELEDCFSSLSKANFTPPELILETIEDSDVVLCNKAMLDNNIISRLNNVKLICVAATGTNNIDLKAAGSMGIRVCNARRYAAASLVQHVFMLILNLHGNFLQFHQAVKQGQWQKSRQFCLLDYPIEELAGRTLGIVGYGDLGQAMERMAKAFGMRVLIAERADSAKIRFGRIAFESVLKQCDILSLHCPLSNETRNLIDAKELDLMKSSAFLINTARGGLVNESALLHALRKEKIAGAALDVLEVEPPLKGNALLDLDMPNLIISPHIAWASRQARQRLVQELVLNLRAFYAGQRRNIVGFESEQR